MTTTEDVQKTIADLKGVPTRQELLDLLGDEIVNVTFDKSSPGNDCKARFVVQPNFDNIGTTCNVLSANSPLNLSDSPLIIDTSLEKPISAVILPGSGIIIFFSCNIFFILKKAG